AVERVVDRRDRLRFAPADVEFAHAHAAEADRRHFRPVAAEPPLIDSEHVLLPFLTADPAPRFFEAKWDFDALVARGRARDNLHFCTADPERLGQQLRHRRVRRSVGRRFGDPDLQLLAPLGAGPPAADPRLGRARGHPDRQPRGQSMWTIGVSSDLLPRFMKKSSGRMTNVTIIISLKSSR